MSEQMNNSELVDRLQLIESMIAEGRRKTESWGWTFVLWGLAYFVAIFWSNWSAGGGLWPAHLFVGNQWIWPVVMMGTAAVTLSLGTRLNKGNPNTGAGRAISSIWSAVGVSMFLIFPALGFSGHLNPHIFLAVVTSMLAVANGASGFVLKWVGQIACAAVWWAASVAVCFGSEQQALNLFLGALFLCQVVFGIYAMGLEARRRRQEAHHG